MCAEGYWYRGYYEAMAKFTANDEAQINNDNDIGSLDDDNTNGNVVDDVDDSDDVGEPGKDGPGCVSCGSPRTSGTYCGGGLCLPVPQEGFWSQGVDGSTDDMNKVGQYIYVCRSKGCTGAPTLDQGCYTDWHIKSYPDLTRRRLLEQNLTIAGRVGVVSTFEEARNSLISMSVSHRTLLTANDTNITVYDGVGRTVESAPTDKDNICSPGAWGPLCQACDEGWFFDAAKTVTCKECEGSSMFAALPGFLAMIGVIMIIKYRGVLPLPASLKKILHLKKDPQLPFVAALSHIPPGQLKVIWSTIQIITAIAENLEMSFPEPMSTLSVGSSVLNLDFLSVDCSASGTNFHSNVYSTSAFPLILVGLIWLIYWIERGLHAWKVSRGAVFTLKQERAFRKGLYDGYFATTLTTTYLFLPTASLSQFKGMNCFSYEASTQSFLKADSSIDCNGPAHQTFVIYNGILIIFYQSVIVFYFLILYLKLDKINPSVKVDGDVSAALRLRDLDRSIDHIRFLFNDTRVTCWYHEVLDMYRRMFFIGVLPLTAEEPAIKAYIGAAAAMLMTVYFREVLPSRNPFTNLLAIVSQYQILFVFLAALFIITRAIRIVNVSEFALGCLLVFANTIVLVGAIYAGWLSYLRELKRMKRRERKVSKIEYAAEFDDEKFELVLGSVSETSIDESTILAYHYTSMAAAKYYARNGIPTFSTRNYKCWSATHVEVCQGVVFSLKGPHEIKHCDPCLEKMSPLSACREAVLCVAVPRELLFPLVEPFMYDSQIDEQIILGSFDAVKRGSFDAANRGSFDAAKRGSFDAANRGSFDSAKRGSFDAAKHGSFDAAKRGSFNVAKRGSKVGQVEDIGNASGVELTKNAQESQVAAADEPKDDEDTIRARFIEAFNHLVVVPTDVLTALCRSGLDEDEVTVELKRWGFKADQLKASAAKARKRAKLAREAETKKLGATGSSEASEHDSAHGDHAEGELEVDSDGEDVRPKDLAKRGQEAPDAAGGAPAEAVVDEDTQQCENTQQRNLHGEVLEEYEVAHGADMSLGKGAFLSGDLDGDGIPDFPPIEFTSQNILRAYQLVADTDLDDSQAFTLLDFVCPEVLSDLAYFTSKYDVDKKKPTGKSSGPKVRMPVTVTSCEEYLGRMAEIREECEKRGLVPMYYYTLPFAANMIAHSGFRYLSATSKDGGICFTTQSPASYEVGTFEYEPNLISDMMGPDNVEEMSGAHKLDVCFVYAAEPKVLRQVPTGRDTAKMVPKFLLENFSEPEPGTGDFLLRPDRIVASFMLDPLKPLTGYEDSKVGLKAEKKKDNKIVQRLTQVEAAARYNDSISRGEHGFGEGQTPWPRMDMVSENLDDDVDDMLEEEDTIDPMIFWDGDFGVPDWAAAIVDIDGPGGVKIRDLPKIPSFADDQDPAMLVGLNVHLKGLELDALNDWTGVVKGWKPGDGKERANYFTVALDAGLPGFLPGFEFSCEGNHLELAQEQGEKNKPRPRGEARFQAPAPGAEIEQLSPKKRAALRAKTAKQKFALLDSAEAVKAELEEQEEKAKAEEKLQGRIKAVEEKKAKKRKSRAAKQLKEEEKRRAKEKKWIEAEVKRKMAELKSKRDAKIKAKQEEEQKQREAAAKQLEVNRQNIQARLGPEKVTAAERMVERLDEALDAWQVKIYGDAWEKWVAVLLAARAKASALERENRHQLAKTARQKRRELEKRRSQQHELRLQGNMEAMAEFDAHVAIIVDRGGYPKMAKAFQVYCQRLSFESWKMHTVAGLEAELWKRCLTEFTRKNGYPPKLGSLWMLSSPSAQLLGEPKPAETLAARTATGKEVKAAAAAAASGNRKTQRGVIRDARKLAKIRDKLEAKDPPSGLQRGFIEQVRPERNWRSHVNASYDGDNIESDSLKQIKEGFALPALTTGSSRSSRTGGDMLPLIPGARRRSHSTG